jgi:hypothetical protein
MDVDLEGEITAEWLWERLHQVTPEGLDLLGLWKLPAGSPGLGKLIRGFDLALVPPAEDGRPIEQIAAGFLASASAPVERAGPSTSRAGARSAQDARIIDVRTYVSELHTIAGDDAAKLARVFGWPEAPAMLVATVASTADGSAKPSEVAQALGFGRPLLARIGLRGMDAWDRGLGDLASAAAGITYDEDRAIAAEVVES